jgi:hypothetical protein
MKNRNHKYAWTIVVTTPEIYHSYLNELNKDLRPFVDEYVQADNYFLAIGIADENVFGGFAVSKNGELHGLFALDKNCGKQIFERQIRIGSLNNDSLKLNCTGDFLKEFYESFGFKVYLKMRWDERLAQKNWNSERFGMPNIYFMKRTYNE